jgi:hypothetical protein
MTTSETAEEYVSETTADLLHDLSRRLDLFWRYDQYISNCNGETALRAHWCAMKLQETRNIETLKSLLRQRALGAHF